MSVFVNVLVLPVTEMCRSLDGSEFVLRFTIMILFIFSILDFQIMEKQPYLLLVDDLCQASSSTCNTVGRLTLICLSIPSFVLYENIH